MAREVDAAALLIYLGAWAKDMEAVRVARELETAKLCGTEVSQRVIDTAAHLRGGYGARTGHTVEFLNETRALRIYESAPSVQKVITPRAIQR